MSGVVEGWTLGENAIAAWARDGQRVDVTVDADAVEVEIDTRDAGTVTATIPRAVLVELLRRTSKCAQKSPWWAR